MIGLGLALALGLGLGLVLGLSLMLTWAPALAVALAVALELALASAVIGTQILTLTEALMLLLLDKGITFKCREGKASVPEDYDKIMKEIESDCKVAVRVRVRVMV